MASKKEELGDATYQVGDRVYCLFGAPEKCYGTVRSVDPLDGAMLVEFEGWDEGHQGTGLWWVYPKDINLAELPREEEPHHPNT